MSGNGALAKVDDSAGSAKNWCFTLNNPNDRDRDNILRIGKEVAEGSSKEVRYIIVGVEVGASGTQHYQGYIQMYDRKTLLSMIKLIPRAHMEKARGSCADNQRYCSKDGNYQEAGTALVEGQRSDLTMVYTHIHTGGDISSLIERGINYQGLRYAETIQKYVAPVRDWKTYCVWIHGPSGSGKSYEAFRMAAEYPSMRTYVKNMSSGKWWDGYDNHEIVIFDDVRQSRAGLGSDYETFLCLTGNGPFKIEAKGRVCDFVAKMIIFTCVHVPEMEFYKQGEPEFQVTRRIDKRIELKETRSEMNYKFADGFVPPK